MSAKAVELAIRVSADADDAEAAFGSVGDAAQRMADDVDAAARVTDGAASRLDNVAEAADNMGSKSAQAAGGLGDLGGALSMMPGPLGAVGAGMEAVAPAIMGVTGAMDLVNLATESNIVLTARARVAAIAHAATSRVIAAATRVWALAQRALNLSMLASPIGLVVAGVLLLVAGLVLAYRKSETFRNIVQGAMRGVQAAVGWVVDKVESLVGWVRDTLPAAWQSAKELVTSAATGIKNKVIGAFDAMLAPVQWVIDKVEKLIDLIQNIPGIPGGDATGVGTAAPGTFTNLPKVAGRSYVAEATPAAAPTPVTVNLTLDGYTFVGDENALATAIAAMLARMFTRLGVQVPGWPQVIGMGT